MKFKMRNRRYDRTRHQRMPADHGIGWMPEGVSGVRAEDMTLSEKIYRTPAALIVGICAAAGLAFCLVVFLISLIFGLRIYGDYDADGARLRYFGIMKGDVPVSGTIYLPDGEKGSVNGEKIRFSDGSRYEGGMDGLLFDGEGVYTDTDGNVYKGTFERGSLEGEGVIEFADGGVFRGSFLNGKRDGYGEYVGADGSSYKGYYAEDEKSGYGVLVYSDKSEYKGYFQNDMRHGEGSYRFASGDLYTGEFRNNVICGHGSYFFASGRVFTGEFKNGIPVVEIKGDPAID